jgi:hypothetical protein
MYKPVAEIIEIIKHFIFMLAYFKAKLQRTDVSGKVKGHFKSNMECMCLLGEKVVI